MDPIQPETLPFGFGLSHSPLLDFDVPPLAGTDELLDNDERQYLDSFFQRVNRNGYTDPWLGEGLGGIFTNEWRLPPEIIGHNVSYGTVTQTLVEAIVPDPPDETSPHAPPTSPSHMMASAPNFRYFQKPPRDSASPGTPADVIAAASVLSRTSAPNFDMPFSTAQETLTSASLPLVSLQNLPVEPSARDANHFSPNQHHQGPQNGAVFGAVGRGETYVHRPRRPLEEVRFGSDPNFSRHNFVPASERETTEAMMAEQLATLGCLKRNISAAPTRAPSPTSWSPSFPNATLHSSRQLNTTGQNPPIADDSGNSELAHSRKRRKYSRSGKGSSDESIQQTFSAPASAGTNLSTTIKREPTTSGPRRRKPPNPLTPEAEAVAAGPKKRRRSGAAGASSNPNNGAANGSSRSSTGKVPRENLTEEQKRENHIKSEQKRRNIIKSGYENLERIVPDIKGNGYSRAVTLKKTADWLVELEAGNRRLEEMLLKLERGRALT
ncbi:neurogenic locus notch protein 2 [Achaetomium macrosporum]|uniref:Neurogenic locus notch protein 2 n=1 Tax=Achaetomium macrosporum TaxID=79813 RepID=A0AAN7CFZ7_9PEZI|nr:neurogenic locus notch protein 2 [Achaetomium macrosporum]